MVAAATVAALLSSCSSTSLSPPRATPPTGAARPVAVKEGGTLVFANQSDVENFNVNTVAGHDFTTQQVMDRVWPQTFLVNPQGQPVLDTELVQSAELVSTAPQTIVYKINPNAVWSDGVPIDATDFIYNWRAQSGTGADLNGKPYDVASVSGYDDIASVTGSDNAKTVTVVFREPFSDWESLFSNLVPAHIAERVGWNTGFITFDPATVISGGPFIVASDTPGSQIVLTRNPRYWGPPANLTQIVFRLVTSQGDVPTYLAFHQVDMIYPVPDQAVVDETRRIAGVRTEIGNGLSYEHLDFNLRSPVLADIAVRRGIADALDIPQIIAATVKTFAKGVEPDGNHIFVNSQSQYRNNRAGYGRGHIADALQQFATAGYTRGPDGFLQRNGQPLVLRITTTTENSVRLQAEQAIVAQLGAVGVHVVVANADTRSLISQVLPSGSYDMVLFAWNTSPFGSQTAPLFETNNPTLGTGSQNWTGFSDPEVDRLYLEARHELNPLKAAALYNRIDRRLWTVMVSVSLYQRPTMVAYDAAYANIHDNGSSSGPFWDAELWGLKP